MLGRTEEAKKNNSNKNIKSRKKLNGKFVKIFLREASIQMFFTVSANFSSPYFLVLPQSHIYTQKKGTFISSQKCEPLPTPIFYLLWIKRWWQNREVKATSSKIITQNIWGKKNVCCVCLKNTFCAFSFHRLGWKNSFRTQNTEKWGNKVHAN